jgi:hypothetical protein
MPGHNDHWNEKKKFEVPLGSGTFHSITQPEQYIAQYHKGRKVDENRNKNGHDKKIDQGKESKEW